MALAPALDLRPASADVIAHVPANVETVRVHFSPSRDSTHAASVKQEGA